MRPRVCSPPHGLLGLSDKNPNSIWMNLSPLL